MKRTISIALLCAMLTVSSCGSQSTSDDTTAANDTSAVDTTPDIYGYVDPELPNKNYNGRDFTIIYPEWGLYNDFYFVTESSGDVMDDAIYERARRVEEKFNISFKYHSGGSVDAVYPAIQQAVAAGDSAYDLAAIHCQNALGSYVSDGGIIVSWNDMPGVDLDKPYWDQSVRELFEIDGVLPYMSSDYIIPDIYAIYFNKGLINDYSLEDPYQLVLDGKWTWAKLKEMSTKVAKDLNGDNVMDMNDQYGLIGQLGSPMTSAINSCNQRFVDRDSDGELFLSCDNEKTQNILEIICNIIYRDNSGYFWKNLKEYDVNSGGTPPMDFGNGNALFEVVSSTYALTFRSKTVDYGILPFPKYDEAQDGYISTNWAGLLCVPKTAEDLELVGMVAEMLAAESCRTVLPAYYDKFLGEKIAQDEMAQQMLDIIFDGAIYDLGINLGIMGLYSTQFNSDAPNITTVKASYGAKIDEFINSYVDGCRSYN